MKKFLLIGAFVASLSIVFGISQIVPSSELKLDVPIEGMRGNIGQCRVEILDPEDNVIGTAKRYVYVIKDYHSLPVQIKLNKKVDDYDLLRARVTFKKVERIYSLFQLQDRMIVKILGQNEFVRNTPINYRVIATNGRSNEPIKNAKVKIIMKKDAQEIEVFQGITDRFGTCKTDFDIPDDIDNAELHFAITSDIGSETYTTNIKITSGNLTYLVTDKPIYQPGQTIHIRTLSLRRPDLSSVSDANMTFEIEDSKGNKIFKKKVATDDFGTGYVQFLLADELNFGDYTIRAILDQEKVEKTVKVQKYVLPKFKINITTDKAFYLPSGRLEGTLDVQYFFGKPVVDGDVIISIYRFDIGFQKESEIKGRTDKDGIYHFVYELPDCFVGEPLEKGDAFIRLDVEVRDKANHSEKLSLTRKVVQDIIRLSIVPEGGTLRPNLENRIYVLAVYPDGTPCVADIETEINGMKMHAKTDNFGIAEFSYTPAKSDANILVKAQDDKGETAQLEKSFSLDTDRDQIIMKMARGIYKVGESIVLQFLSTKKTGRVYLDIIKDNQTVLTKSIEIRNGKGDYRLNLSPDLAGSIWLHAYIVTPGSDIIRDTRFCYVHAANDLLIDVKPDKAEYLPGQDGSVLFTIKGKDGYPRIAALCIAVVDEAVFAVSELQPGLEKVYFTLEREIMEPRYEIHGFTPVEIVQKEEIQARAENLMFSTLTPKEPYVVNYTTPQEVDSKIMNAFYTRLTAARDRIYNALSQYYSKHNEYPKSLGGIDMLISEGLLKEKDITDPWARKYRIVSGDEYLSWFTITCAGPDGVFDNADDISEWGWGRGMMEDEMMLQMVPEAAAERPMIVAGKTATDRSVSKGGPAGNGGRNGDENGGKQEPRIREFFPETFIFEPALITDRNGEARLNLTMPDAITTWRVTTFASSQHGELGSTLAQIRVFQDFFVDIDLPISLTEGDEISVPIALYNYLDRIQEVKIQLQQDDWFEILEKNEISKKLDRDEVSVVYFPIRVKKIGYHSILVKAYGEAKSDAIKRMIEVVPDGKRYEDIISDRLEGNVVKRITFPGNAVKEANSLMLKLFPGIYSQIVEGLEKLLGVPYGCFEQTSSVTYPNILILNYLRETEQIRPETEMAAEEYISLGYQRLLSFEVSGGGFSWFGDAPANKILTAYGLMEFSDMAKVYEIDERVIERTAQWLRNQQNKDGSWSPDAQYLHEEAWGNIQKNEILPTAYICWALGEIGEKDEAINKGLAFLKQNLNKAGDPYILALMANAFVANEPKGETTFEVLKRLVAMAKEQDNAIYWESKIPSITFSRGNGVDIEATGLAAYALIKSGKYSDVVTKVLTYLIRAKDASGLWYTTQGTIIALRSLVAALGGTVEDINAQVSVLMNGKKITDLQINNDNADVMQQIDLSDNIDLVNTVEIKLQGEGNFLYELVNSYYLPWEIVPRPVKPPFDITVNYDRTNLVINDLVNVGVSIKLLKPGKAQMVMIDLGIPPGFAVQTPTLDELVGKKIQKYDLTPRQLIIYLDEVVSGKPVEFSYSIKAKYPIKAKVRASRVYEYYNVEDEGTEKPIEMKVTLSK